MDWKKDLMLNLYKKKRKKKVRMKIQKKILIINYKIQRKSKKSKRSKN